MDDTGNFSNAELEQAIERTEKVKAIAAQDGNTDLVKSCEDITAYIRGHWMTEGGGQQ